MDRLSECIKVIRIETYDKPCAIADSACDNTQSRVRALGASP